MSSIRDFAKGWLLMAGLLLFTLNDPVRRSIVPFLLALVLALAVRRPIARLEQHMPRALASLLILTLAGLLGLSFMAIAAVRLWQLVPRWLDKLPDTLRIWESLASIGTILPVALRPSYLRLLEILQSQSIALMESWTGEIAQWAGGLIQALPGKLFTFGITLLATFYAASDWPRVSSGLAALLPRETKERLPQIAGQLKRGMTGWLRAQGKLMVLSFLVLLAGFWILGLENKLILSASIALADALPFLGTGLILLPWALFSLLEQETARALGLVLIWLAALILRSVLEPRLLGRQAGVSPLLTLFSMYAGLRLFGLWGLIGAPILLSGIMGLQEEKEKSPEDS